MKFYRHYREIADRLGFAADAPEVATAKAFPVCVNEYYLGLINPAAGKLDPIARQALPDPAELGDTDSSFDPLDEVNQMPVPRLIRRYADRAVLLTTGRCAMHCRFCFRKREWAGGESPDINAEEIAAAAAWLTEHPEVKEVLLSGGDPLMLPMVRLRELIEAVRAVPSIEVIRVGSRIPVVWPQRITRNLAAYLGSVPGLWFATHFNHPREVTPEASEACGRLIKNGVPVINQTVLLKGVNDDWQTLEELFRKLVAVRVRPHYLFHVDPVRSVRHFATGVEAGLEILRRFRPRLSSLAVPAFAIDLPEGGGKVALQPCYGAGGVYCDIAGMKKIRYPDAPELDKSGLKQ